MPLLKLTTNSMISDDQSSKLLCELSQLLAKETGKPERYVMISLTDKAGKLRIYLLRSVNYLLSICLLLKIASTSNSAIAPPNTGVGMALLSANRFSSITIKAFEDNS
jgi:hypothetical protein